MMTRIRSATVEDVDLLAAMISESTLGLTSLKLDHEQLFHRLEQSEFAFRRKSDTTVGLPYVFIMEDEATGKMIGTSTVYSKVGGYVPFYAYKKVNRIHQSEEIGVQPHERTSLHLTRVHDGPTEIGSLFLLPEYRGKGRGKFLSLIRFQFIAMRRERFADRVIAELRGFCDDNGEFPFWESAMRRFFRVDYDIADTSSTISKSFIEDLIPEFPIEVDLLEPAARESIGRVNRETEPAMRMLYQEGFCETPYVDIFDAGPVVEAETDQIGAVRRTGVATVVDRNDVPTESMAYASVAVCDQHCRAVVASMDSQRSSDIGLTKAQQEWLGIKPGDEVSVMNLS